MLSLLPPHSPALIIPHIYFCHGTVSLSHQAPPSNSWTLALRMKNTLRSTFNSSRHGFLLDYMCSNWLRLNTDYIMTFHTLQSFVHFIAVMWKFWIFLAEIYSSDLKKKKKVPSLEIEVVTSETFSWCYWKSDEDMRMALKNILTSPSYFLLYHCKKCCDEGSVTTTTLKDRP